jgi:parallel beta-helix repeat protein
MTDSIRWLYRASVGRYVLASVFLIACLLAVGVFVADASDAQPDPVPFDQTTAFGLPSEDRFSLEARNLSIPRVQVFYSQYSYVVGYEGVERAVETLTQPGHTRQFGVPLTVYVSDYSETGVELTADGYLRPDHQPGWVAADEAVFVVGSGARTSTGETVVPFGTRRGAESFASANDGEILTWTELKSREFALEDATVVRDQVAEQQQSADGTVAQLQWLRERDATLVVGEDAPTVQAAIDSVPANGTVVVPEGTYDEQVTVDRPVTVRGRNATLRGNGTGTVIRVTHDDVAVSGVRITGVGPDTRPSDAFEDGGGQWDDRIDDAYGRSDAGIRVNASNVLISDVAIQTPTTGVLIRDSTDIVVDGLTVDGTEEPMAGFMGVLSIRSPIVVQQSTFDGGRDGIYLHRAHGSVLRNNTFLGQRFGIHFMYTSETLAAGNTARNQTTAGIVIMTSPTRNAVVGNDVRHAADGIITSGSRSYIADNVVAYGDQGIQAGTEQSLYERNVLYGNDVGIRTDTVLPSNRIRLNDFVANDQHARAGIGPLRIWTDGGTGNYWEGAHGFSTGTTLAHSYSPTNPVERQFHLTDGAVTLAESPAARALAAIRDRSPGLRQGSIVDTSPRVRPVQPAVVAELRATNATSERTSVDGTDGENDD